MKIQVYLSRRNLEILLSKLDRQKQGDDTKCTVIKYKIEGDPYVQGADEIVVTAVENDLFYTNRNPGPMHPADEPGIKT